MSGHEGERRRLGLVFAGLLSLLVHLLLIMVMAVYTLRDEIPGVDKKLERARPEAKAKQSASDFELVVTKEDRPRPVHESPLEVAVEKPATREDSVERPTPAERVVSPKAAQAEPLAAPVAIELPRAAAAPKAAVETPTKLSRKESDLGSESAEVAAAVAVPESVVEEAKATEPQPPMRRPQAAPRSVVKSVATARPRADAATAPEPMATTRTRSAATTAAVDSPELASLARAATATDAAGPPGDTSIADVKPLSATGESGRQEPSPPAASVAARARPQPTAAASRSVASRVSRPSVGDPSPESAAAIDLRREVTTPKASADTPTKLARNDSALRSETAEAAAAVNVPETATSAVAAGAEASRPQPAARRPQAAANSAVRSVSTSRPNVEAATGPEPVAAARTRSAAAPTAVKAPELASLARAATATDAAGSPGDEASDDVKPLSVAGESGRQEPSVSAASAAARARPQSSAAASRAVASRVSRPDGGNPGTESAVAAMPAAGIGLPREVTAPKVGADTPTKLARKESALGSEPAAAAAAVPAAESMAASDAGGAEAIQPQPSAARPQAGPRSEVRSVSSARPNLEATTAPEAVTATRTRSAAATAAVDSQELASLARAATGTVVAAPSDDEAGADVEPLSVAGESGRQEPGVPAASAAARARPQPSVASSRSVASRASGPGGGDPAPESVGPRVTARGEPAVGAMPAVASDALARAAATGLAAGDVDDVADVAGLVGNEPTNPPAGDGPADAFPAAVPARRPKAAAGSRGLTAAPSPRRSGRPGSAADEAVAEDALASRVGGRPGGIAGIQGDLDAPESSSPGRQTPVGASDVAAASVAVDAAKIVPAADRTADPFASIAASQRPVRPSRGSPRPSVLVSGPDGPGGSEDEAGPQPGITARPSRRPTDSLLENDERFLARVAAAALPVDGRVRQMAAAFLQRSPDRRDQPRQGNRGTDTKAKATIERGLEFLSRAQLPDGRWSLSRFPGATSADVGSIASDTAATGLALLCFLGAGYDHFGDRHADTVRRGLGFLRAVQKADGDLYLESDEASGRSARLYSHAIATMALCEAVGMTGDPLLRESADKACRFIASSQHEKRGGWRYAPGVGSDLSVSGWMLVALRSAQIAGIEVDRRCLAGVRVLLDTSQSVEDADTYVYNPYAPDTPEQRAGRRSSPTMTAVGLLMRLHTGYARDDPRFVGAATKLAAELPSNGSRGRPTRDCYLWYYVSQVLFHVGGEAWDRWYGRLYEILVASQETVGDRAGSWNPGGEVPDRWGAFGGRIYVTALNLLTLEVTYRHLPIDQAVVRPADDRETGRSSP